jgi:predicted aldo/keto reductase-like oxidoreductase
MQYREYGKTGIKVSVLGVGGLQLPKVKGRSNTDVFIELFRRAIDLGVNYVDTAAMSHYKTEIPIGKTLQGRKDKVYIATKNHYRGKSADEWQKYLDQSLERLNMDCIDFYHLHNMPWNVYRKQLVPGKVMERFRKAKDEGLIRYMCFSSHDKPENIMKLIATGEFDGMLVQYNLLDRSNEDAIAFAHEKGLGVAIMGPIAGGRLAAPVERVRTIVGGASSTPEIALRFVLSNPYVTLALSSMTTMPMVVENVATASRAEPLSPEERQQIVQALEEMKRLSDLYCTGCGYCLPCPQHVYIPANFEAMNYYQVWGLVRLARKRYQRLGRNKSRTWAAVCVGCGTCEPKCPQQIPIRERLKETVDALGKHKT